MKNFLFYLFFGFIFKSNAQEINVDYFNNFRRAGVIFFDSIISSNVKNFGNIQTQSLSGRYYYSDKFSLGIGLNYRLNKNIFFLQGNFIQGIYIFNFNNKNIVLNFSPTFKLPIKKIKGLGQYSPELFFSYCIGIGKSHIPVLNVYSPTFFTVDYEQVVTIPSFFQLHASVPLKNSFSLNKNSFSLNISLRGAQKDLNNLDDDLFAIRPVQVGFGIGYKFNSFKSRNTKGTREVI